MNCKCYNSISNTNTHPHPNISKHTDARFKSSLTLYLTKRKKNQHFMSYNSLWWQLDGLYRSIWYSGLQVKHVIVENGELVEIKHDEPNVGHLHKRPRKAPWEQIGWRTFQKKNIKMTTQTSVFLLNLRENLETKVLFFHFFFQSFYISTFFDPFQPRSSRSVQNICLISEKNQTF